MPFYALAPRLKNERERQAAVDRYGTTYERPEVAKALVAEAAELFDAKIGIATVIDKQRMVVSARHGNELNDVDRDISFCGHAIANPDEVMCVFDAAYDPRFAGNPLVQGEPRIRFYVGAPLVAPCGNVLGALCAIDTHPKASLMPAQLDKLKALAVDVTAELLR